MVMTEHGSYNGIIFYRIFICISEVEAAKGYPLFYQSGTLYLKTNEGRKMESLILIRIFLSMNS